MSNTNYLAGGSNGLQEEVGDELRIPSRYIFSIELLGQSAVIRPLGHGTYALGVPLDSLESTAHNMPLKGWKGGILDLTKVVHQFRDNCEQVLAAIELKREPSKEEAWTIEYYCKRLLSKIERRLRRPSSKD